MNRVWLIILVLGASFSVLAQPEDLTQVWPAKWIRCPEGSPKDFGVFYFRKSFELESVPDSLLLNVSADNRYQLFVNGELASWGPQRGDLDHWMYETVDVSDYLVDGANTLAAVVWNYGAYLPDAQFTVETGFLLAAGDKQFRFLNTDEDWKSYYDRSYAAIPPDRTQIKGYFGAGSTELFEAMKHPWGWNLPDYNDKDWPQAERVGTAMARTCIWASPWKLTPRQVAMEQLMEEKFNAIRLWDGLDSKPGLEGDEAAIQIPARQKVRLVFDMRHETTGFPNLRFSRGENAMIQLKYSEALYAADAPKSDSKGNRDSIAGKNFFGVYDQVIADGSSEVRNWQPLWWRAFRYVEMQIETSEDPLTIHSFSNWHNRYPYQREYQFQLDQNNLYQNILEVGERTARLCAHETYMDCPYYEQSQFEGDTRIQALVSYYNFGDPTLARSAIEQFDWSRNELGYLSARYPATSSYYIPNYSLFWIGMLHDYYYHVNDVDFVATKVNACRIILRYFLERQQADGTIRRPEFHNFVDWSFPRGEAPFDQEGNSALVDLHVLLALQWAMDLERDLGEDYYLKKYQKAADRLKVAIEEFYFDPELGLFRDTGSPGSSLSVHTNCMAIITGLRKGEAAGEMIKRTFQQQDVIQPSVYWHFYLFEAMHKAGMGRDYLANLDIWESMLEAGCTTWPETQLASRSECHAWGASPNYHFFKIVAGIQSDGPAFKKVKISPAIGGKQNLSATIPHPNGKISVRMKSGVAVVEIPAGVEGTFTWQEETTALKPGENQINY